MTTGLEIVSGERDRGRGSVEQAVPEPERLSASAPASVAQTTLRTKTRGSLLTSALVAAAALAFIGFAHQQSVSRAGVPMWLDWARDTQDPAADPDRAKAGDPDRKASAPDSDATAAPK